MEAAPNNRIMTVPRQRRVIGAERSTWQELGLLPEGYSYLYLGDNPLMLNGAYLVLKVAVT
jgi:hypothetical protein